jgi:hypothetical protein
VQRGNQVILSWPAPRRNASSGSVQSIRRIDVYRVAEEPNAPLPMTEEEFAARATLIGSVAYGEIQTASDSLTYTDKLELAGEPSRLRYAVRYVNASGQRAAFSNFLLIEPAAKIAEPPSNVRKEETETAITIRWDAPKQNIDGSTPVNLLGYNVYRVIASQTEIGQTPINSGLGDDRPSTRTETSSLAEKYTYVVRSVSLGTLARQVESLNSNGVEAAPADIYPPSAPSGISIAPAPGRLSLFFAANPEPDIAGYLIYRSTDPNQPKPWTLLTQALLTKTTFTDENVDPGKTYHYYVIAVDTAGNKSQPSEVVSETAP